MTQTRAHPLTERRGTAMQAAVRVATGLLLAVLAWKAALVYAFARPPRARLALERATRDEPHGYRLLVGGKAGPTAHRSAELPAAGSDEPLPLRSTSWPAPSAPLHRLLASLGYSTGPVLLTIDADGHIVRVEAPPKLDEPRARLR